MTHADTNKAAGRTGRRRPTRPDANDHLAAAFVRPGPARTPATHAEKAAKRDAADRGAAQVLSDAALRTAGRAHLANLAELREVERAQELLAAERQVIEQVLIRRRDDDGDDLGRPEVANLAAERYLHELDESLAELRDRLAALGQAAQRLAAEEYGFSIESGRAIPGERPDAFSIMERMAPDER